MAVIDLIQTTTEVQGTTESSTEDEHSFSGYDITLVLMLVTAIVMNAVCIVAIIRERLHEEDNRYLFMANLAVSDLLMSAAFAVETLLTRIGNLGSPYTSNVVCIVANTFVELTFPAELFSLLILTVDTFLHIELHMKYHVYITKHVAYAGLGLVAALSVLQLVPFYKITSENGWQCVEHGTYPDWYNYYVIVVCGVLPFVLLIALHGRILYTARKQIRKIAAAEMPPTTMGTSTLQTDTVAVVSRSVQDDVTDVTGSTDPTNGNSDATAPREHTTSLRLKRLNDKKAFITATVMVGAVVASWIPSYVVLGILTEHPEAYNTPSVYNTLQMSTLIFLCNTLVNPLIYIARVPEVRRAIKRLFISSA